MSRAESLARILYAASAVAWAATAIAFAASGGDNVFDVLVAEGHTAARYIPTDSFLPLLIVMVCLALISLCRLFFSVRWAKLALPLICVPWLALPLVLLQPWPGSWSSPDVAVGTLGAACVAGALACLIDFIDRKSVW